MSKTIAVSAPAEEVFNDEAILRFLAKNHALAAPELTGFRIIRRSIDARKRPIKINMLLEIFLNEPMEHASFDFAFKPVHNAPQAVIVGAGPAGLFAALKLIELGVKPVIFERGKNVKDRRRDLVEISRNRSVNPDSNYCFGEGGAGTYSDGKLYTRSSKRGDVMRILKLFVAHGADPAILYDSHPHIGTNRLPGIITAIRETILHWGGEVHFSSRLTNIKLINDAIAGVTINGIGSYDCQRLILATGHSARDIYYLLHSNNVLIEPKPYAAGVRVEHPQQLIDEIQYRTGGKRPAYLPPATYSLVHQVDGRGVFSFCMCPGGIIAPAMTSPGEIVVNGWSPSRRNNPYANSGIVAALGKADFTRFNSFGALAGLKFQESVESRCFELGNKTLAAPAQRLTDFLERKISGTLPQCSYPPGTVTRDVGAILPDFIASSLRSAFSAFDRKMKGFITEDAVVVATESRTSAPVRIPRDHENRAHPQIAGLFPCGEGAGYAGGIVSAAMDGENAAVACARTVFGGS
jgi:hypothetical protein